MKRGVNKQGKQRFCRKKRDFAVEERTKKKKNRSHFTEKMLSSDCLLSTIQNQQEIKWKCTTNQTTCKCLALYYSILLLSMSIFPTYLANDVLATSFTICEEIKRDKILSFVATNGISLLLCFHFSQMLMCVSAVCVCVLVLKIRYLCCCCCCLNKYTLLQHFWRAYTHHTQIAITSNSKL